MKSLGRSKHVCDEKQILFTDTKSAYENDY